MESGDAPVTLTLDGGPLSARPPQTVNYRVEGPRHRLLLTPFPRRVRAVLGGETVLDTRRGQLLHETAHLPQLYLPREDVRADLLEPTDHRTHCPFKGDASYLTVRARGAVAEDAIWAYSEPLPEARWLRGLVAPYWGAMDGWWDEDEPVAGHLRDPYHRVDVRMSSRHVRVLVGDTVVAEADRVALLSETGLPNRYYLPPESVRADLLEESATRTICPYKGEARYRHLRVGGSPGRRIADAAWLYPEPLEGAAKARGHLSFTGRQITLEVDGTPMSPDG